MSLGGVWLGARGSGDDRWLAGKCWEMLAVVMVVDVSFGLVV